VPATRRTFLKLLAASGAAIALPGRRVIAGPGPGKVFVAHSTQMTSNDPTVKRTAIGAGLDSCLVELARSEGAAPIARVGDAWEWLLGGVTPTTKIAVHVTAFFVSLDLLNSPQWETIQAIVAGLKDMLAGSFPAGNIRVFDNNMSGINRVNAVYGASNLDGLGVAHDLNTYGGPTLTVNGTTLYQHVYMGDADVIINLARLSGHQYEPGSGPGITGCVKGLMGATSASQDSFGGIANVFHDTSRHWQGHRDLWRLLRSRVKVNIMDMVRASYHEREAFSADVNEIAVSRDPCAIDGYAAQKLLETFPGTPYAGLSIPEAVASEHSDWSTNFTRVEVPIPAVYDAPPPTRRQVEDIVRAHRAGAATDADVKALIKKYREQ